MKTWSVHIREFYFCCGLVSKEVVWFRFGKKGPGLAIKRSMMLFSERYGYVKYLPIGFGWRVVFWGGR